MLKLYTNKEKLKNQTEDMLISTVKTIQTHLFWYLTTVTEKYRYEVGTTTSVNTEKKKAWVNWLEATEAAEAVSVLSVYSQIPSIFMQRQQQL